MTARPVQRERVAKLKKLGIEEVCDLYVRIGTVQGVCNHLFDPIEGAEAPSARALYKFLHSKDAYWEAWQEAKRARGDREFDLALEKAEATDETNARSKRLQIDVHKWRAERLNKRDYGQSMQHEVSGNVTHEWLEGMKKAEQQRIPEAEHDVIEGEVVEDEE